MHHSEQQPLSAKSESGGGVEDGMSSTSDFVKKLYKMLEDQSFQHVVSWGPQGDCFVVKDMNEFTKSILPRMFKHSNFASFVRQLNKYDFHKVKNTDDNAYGEQSWTFKHPDFHADRRDALENIKRKVPASRKSATSSSTTPASSSSSSTLPPNVASSYQLSDLQAQVDRLNQSQEQIRAHVDNLERNYHDVLVEMVSFQRNMAQQDGLLQNLVQYFLKMENNGDSALQSPTSSFDTNPFVASQEAQRMLRSGTFPESDIARASLFQMNELSRRAEVAGMSFGDTFNGDSIAPSAGNLRPTSRIWTAAANAGLINPDGSLVNPPPSQLLGRRNANINSRIDALQKLEELQRNRPSSMAYVLCSDQNGQWTWKTCRICPTSPEIVESPTEIASMPVEEEEEMVMPSTNNASTPTDPWGDLAVSPSPPSDTTDSSLYNLNHEGLQVYTVGHLMPRSNAEDNNGNWTFDPNTLSLENMVGGQEQRADGSFTDDILSSNSQSSESQTLRVRRSTYVPGWAVPPRVLLVDDDAVSRKLSSKFLQVFGCTIDVAVDGVGAVNKMNLEKYDLVLMDIVMPKLDGVSATSLIRKFDPMTPIISMTSNSKPNEIMTYYSSGKYCRPRSMNDILPKPFSKQGLLDMLEKHLMHLKVIRQLSRIPRSVGIPPLSDPSFEDAINSQASLLNNNNSGLTLSPGPSSAIVGISSPMSYDDGRINPLAGMGLSDDQYNIILQNMVSGEGFIGMESLGSPGSGDKRSLEDLTDDRDSKRSRFELLE
ncbi:HSF-type DNA-binding-domain-containing protein [Mycena floridula]|nr:HSF-type DNA-binding-domain-containing protein [Mycena floridula]